LVDGQIRYSLVCNDEGGILDDVLVNRINASHYGLVVNASNREKIVNWIARCGNGDASNPGSFRLSTFELQFSDHTLETAMIAVQGPESVAVVNQFFNRNFSSMRYYTGQSVEIDGTSYFVSRTGYTGEDGFEIIVPATIAVSVWEKLLGIGSAKGIKPCGLGCRDTLRLEAAMPLYGHELTEAIDPLTAGLSFAVKLEKTDFHGHQALEQIKSKPDRPVRVGLKMATRRIPREHAEIYSGDQRIGEVTSGTFSPTLEQTIAMAYVDSLHSTIGSTVDVDIRGHREPAEVTALPFYRRAKKN
jgi:aminomethyltransferase